MTIMTVTKVSKPKADPSKQKYPDLETWLNTLMPKSRGQSRSPAVEKMRKHVAERTADFTREIENMNSVDFTNALRDVQCLAVDRKAGAIVHAILNDDMTAFDQAYFQPWYMYINTNFGSREIHILKEAVGRKIDNLETGLDIEYQIEREHAHLKHAIRIPF